MLREVRTHDERDDEAIFAEIYPRLRRFAAVVASAGIEPDDLVQEAVANTLGLHRLADLDHPLAYLRTAVLRSAMAQQRKRETRSRALPRLAAAADTAISAYPSDLADLDHLEPRDRAILYLADVEGRSYDDIAGVLDETAQNARLRASRARRRLRAILRSESADQTEEPGHG